MKRSEQRTLNVCFCYVGDRDRVLTTFVERASEDRALSFSRSLSTCTSSVFEEKIKINAPREHRRRLAKAQKPRTQCFAQTTSRDNSSIARAICGVSLRWPRV